MITATIDPGLDRMAFAFWDPPAGAGRMILPDRMGQWLLGTEWFATSSGDPLVERLELIYLRTSEILRERAVQRVLIEIPQLGAGSYFKRRGDQRSKTPKTARSTDGLLLAIGAAVGGCAAAHCNVEQRPPLRLGTLMTADETYEQGRKRIVDRALKAWGKQASASNDDLRSAVAMGLWGEL